ncbi:MAG: hypothetical protein JNL30_07935 [Rubrivivax sp.]|nr:hypothetical protein [Rubrivivax sp.]
MKERLLAQLKEFRQDDEAIWKYQAQEQRRQLEVLRKLGRSDEGFKASLAKAGINVQVLEEESAREAQQFRKAHEELGKIEPPPSRRGRKDPLLMQNVAALAGSHTWIFPPAWEGWGNAETCGLNLALGEVNIESHQTGDGWGLAAVAYGTQLCTLWFYYFPPRAGELLVEPHIDFQGNVAVSAHDHWYTSTHAELELKVHFDLFQHYWDGIETATVVDEHRHDSSAAYWVDDHRVMSKSLSVSANDIVWIKLTTSLYVVAHSSHAHVDCDFRTGANRRIRVEHIWVNLT